MKPHPRIRKTIKWGGAALTVLLVVVWIGNGWWSLSWVSPKRMIRFYDGSVDVSSISPPSANRLVGWIGGYVPQTLWGRWSWRWDDQVVLIGIPLWALPLMTVVPTAIAWRLDILARWRVALP
jgi:hypothetical protein